MTPTELTATDGAERVRSGTLKPSAWMAACQDRIAALDGNIKAWISVDPTVAARDAGLLDDTDWSRRRPAASLAGVPIGVKDVFNTRDLPTAMGSDLWAAFTPGNDARVVRQARLLGAVVAGKTATAEFAVHAPSATVNPRDAGRIAGTSSSGSAVAVATGMVPVALGTQTAGSIIRPASYVGVIGFKPSFGLVPRTGVLKTADTLDTIGWFARSVADARLLFEALRVRGDNYPHVEAGLAAARSRRQRGPLRLALVKAPSWDEADASARGLLGAWAEQATRRNDLTIEELDLRETFGAAHEVHRTLYHRQLAYYFADELATGRVSDVFRAVAEDGARVTLDQYLGALERQRDFEHALARALAPFDAAVTLAVAGEAPPTGASEPRDSCLVWTLAGAPAIALPLLHGPKGLPVGVQVVGARYADETVLDVAATLLPDIVPIADPMPCPTPLPASV
jgi:Asp-tRNA(Asn)/Glu-tRNA(Gln) amidotransferase A subunit family amidase